MKKSFVTVFLLLFLAVPCFCEELTLGEIQQNIYTGMPQSDIISAFGAPTMVTKDAEGCETWIYDRSSSYTRESYHKSWLWLLIFGRRKGCQDKETSQRTMNLILNFDKNSCLKNFTYNARLF